MAEVSKKTYDEMTDIMSNEIKDVINFKLKNLETAAEALSKGVIDRGRFIEVSFEYLNTIAFARENGLITSREQEDYSAKYDAIMGMKK